MNDIKLQTIKDLQDASIDGIAPSADSNGSLRYRAVRDFRTWKNACKQAGLKSRSETLKKNKKEEIRKVRNYTKGERSKRETYPELIEFIAALATVSKHTELNEESISICMNQVRNQHIKARVV